MSEFDAPAPITAPSIRRRSEAEREADDASFVTLRSLGIDRTQALSGRIWTDYNLHDPGVTILEQVCYALTELAYRADLPVADQLCGPDGAIDFERQALLRPDDVLRCRPTTENDYRRVFLDGVKGLADARFLRDPPKGEKRKPGLHRLSLRLSDRGANRAVMQEAARHALTIYRSARTLGEDLDEAIVPVVPTMCTLSLTASISGMRDPSDIMAEIYRRCADRIAGLAHVRSLAELVREERPLDEILDGPLTHRGIIEDSALPAETQDDLAAGDLRDIVMDVEGVMEVAELDIRLEGPPPAGGHYAPLLRVPGDGGHHEDLEIVEQVTLLRRGVRVPLDARAIASRHEHGFQPRLATGSTHAEFERVIRPPRGRWHAPEDYRSVQEDFPIIYGLGRRGEGGQGVGRRAHARVRQMQGYLALFDQLLANCGEQLSHIRDLFAVDAPADRSYWRKILDDDNSPGVKSLQLEPPARIEAEVYAPFDDGATRRGQVLDHLLALYGETLPQNTMRQFLDHLDSRELAAALVRNKTQYLRHILTLTRDRAAGFDVGEELWKRPKRGHPEPTTGLHARVAVLLGFRRWRARPLALSLAGWVARRPAARNAAAKPMAPRPEHDTSWALTWLDAPRRTDEVGRRLRAAVADADLQSELFAQAVNRERFRWLPDDPKKDDSPGRLLLTDAAERRRELGRFASEAQAGEFAQRLRRLMVRANDVCDGLHIVEHILLRRRGPTPPAGGDWEADGLKVTFVFPDWTARTARRPFRRFAAETVEINCPAHVAADCLWLDFTAMRQFEDLYRAWLSRLHKYAHTESAETRARAATRLDQASARLSAFLQTAFARQLGAEMTEPD